MKTALRRASSWHLGALPFTVILRIFLGVSTIVVVVVAGIMLIDSLLYGVGTLSPLQLDVTVWGTYAAWAGAVLPTLGVTVTAATWLAGRHSESLQEAEEAALQVVVEKREGAVASLRNTADWPLVIVQSSPPYARNDAKVVRPNAPRVLFSEETTAVTIRIRGIEFALGTDGTLARAG